MIQTAAAFQAHSALVFPYADFPGANRLIRDIVPRLDQVRASLGAASAIILEAGTTLVDFPHCAVPDNLRPRMFAEHRKALSGYPVSSACRRCAWLAAGCVRVPQAYLDAYGTDGLEPR